MIVVLTSAAIVIDMHKKVHELAPLVRGALS